MSETLPGNSFIVLMVLVFVALLLLFEFLYVVWRSRHGPEAKKLNKRLQALSAARDKTNPTKLLRQRMLSELPTLERRLAQIPRLHALDRLILQSGLNWTVGKLLAGCFASGLFVWLLVGSLMPLTTLLAMFSFAGGAAIPLVYVRIKKASRMLRIQKQLPDALDLITRALRAGHAFSSALKMSGEELVEPIAGEFRTVHDEVNFGVSLQQALSHLSDRVPLTDVRYFVVAVLIQRESGGNLTEILTNLSRLIRERLKLFARIKVLSSEGRLSAWILGLMPFALAGIMNIFNPTFMGPLWTDPIGITIVQTMLVLMAIGVLILIKIVKIRV